MDYFTEDVILLKVIELFSGIGAQTQALKNINLPAQTVAISEIDKYCLDSYYKLHGKVLNLGDITKINLKDVPDCDLLTPSHAKIYHPKVYKEV